MPKYKVLVPFYKLSDKNNYAVNDEIELTEEEAFPILSEGKIELTEGVKKGKK